METEYTTVVYVCDIQALPTPRRGCGVQTARARANGKAENIRQTLGVQRTQLKCSRYRQVPVFIYIVVDDGSENRIDRSGAPLEDIRIGRFSLLVAYQFMKERRG